MEYREFRPGDEGVLNDLYNEVFERERTIEEWQWEYLDTPEGRSIIVVVDLDGELIAHEAMIPMRFHVLGEEHLGGKIEDAYIDIKHRGKKVFGPLTEYCLDLSREHGYTITFGLTARPVNYRLHISRGYKHICSLNAYLGVFDPAAVTADVARVLGFGAPKRLAARAVMGVLAKRFERSTARYARTPDAYEIETVARFDERFDELWNRFVTGRRVITIKRSSEFLNWRYVDNPYRDYAIFAAIVDGKPVGYLCAATVTREDMGLTLKIGVTSDFLVLPGYEAAFASFLRRAVDHWRHTGADMAINWVHRGGTYSGGMVDELKRCGFVSTRGKYDIPYFVRTLGDDVTIDGLYDIDNWHITQAFGGAWV